MIRWLLILLLAIGAPVALPTAAQAQYGGGGPSTIKCWSWNYQRNRCPADLRGATVTKQVDQSRLCGPVNFNWSYDAGGITVNNGCQAIFAVSYGNGGGGFPAPPIGPGPGGGFRTVQCDSINYRPARCALDVFVQPQIQRVLGGNCTLGQTWSWDRGGISVMGGCRALFSVATRNPGGGYPGGGYPGGGYPGGGIGTGAGPNVVECSSWQYRPATCPAFTGRGVRIQSVIAGECIQGQTWGFQPGSIWVNGGCRARFKTF